MKKQILYLIIFAFITGCASEAGQTETTIEEPVAELKQLNISVLLDLSDRVILPPLQPTQSERDVEIVSVLIDVFKNSMTTKGAYLSKDKMRVLFSPAPADPNVNNIAKNLNVDLSKLDNKGKKEVYDNIEKDFEQGLKEIYELTLHEKKWIGSDIWRFFKYDAKELCIEEDPSYQNVLVIVTDGYLYHEQSVSVKDAEKPNRTTYITPKYLDAAKFWNNPNWKDKLDKDDFGFIFSGQTYENLDVMILELNPSLNHKNDEDIIRAYLSKWFDEMKIENKVIYNTDLPQNTKNRIESFFKG